MTEEEADNILDEFNKQPAQITEDEMRQIEAAVQRDNDGIARRAALGALARSAKELMDVAERDRGVAISLAVMADSIRTYSKRLDSLRSMMDSAATRISIALCIREDMSEILEEAKKPEHYQETAGGAA